MTAPPDDEEIEAALDQLEALARDAMQRGQPGLANVYLNAAEKVCDDAIAAGKAFLLSRPKRRN